MKVLVAYMSETGNTKKVAESIYDEITEDKEIKELKDVDSLDGYDLAFIGFPIHAFRPAKAGKDFLKAHTAGKKLAIFITHAMTEGAKDIEGWLEKSKEAAINADVLGTFNCQGELAEPIMEMLLKSDDPNMRAFGEKGPEKKVSLRKRV